MEGGKNPFHVYLYGNFTFQLCADVKRDSRSSAICHLRASIGSHNDTCEKNKQNVGKNK